MKDNSEYYTGDRALDEEVQWILSGQYKRNLEFVLPKIAEYCVQSVVEWGCGSGLVAAGLPQDLIYAGIDSNSFFWAMAQKRCKTKQYFILDDARDFKGKQRDLSMAWAFLKHFGLHEWDTIATKILSAGRFAAFNVMILSEDYDNGTEFHHVYVTEARLQRVLAEAGHEELHRAVLGEGDVLGKDKMKEVALWTRSKS